jgi:hypothetical protein
VLTAAFLWLVGAVPAADAAVPVAVPEPLIAISAPTPEQASSFWQVVIEQQLIIRVPAQRSQLNNFAAGPSASKRATELPLVWKEKKAPKCVAMRNILGMQAVQRDSIDIITRQKQRNKDGKLCEDRDEIHARTGAKCEIDKFRLMVPVRDDDD